MYKLRDGKLVHEWNEKGVVYLFSVLLARAIYFNWNLNNKLNTVCDQFIQLEPTHPLKYSKYGKEAQDICYGNQD